MNAQLAVCGADCAPCPFFQKEFNGQTCAGCRQTKGNPFWAAEDFNGGACPIFDCASTKHSFNSCGECAELPCALFFELKDPSMSDEQHRESITRRVNVLKGLS